ncbi:hypothetical protein THAOC_05830, partial [Thalassiosira oceanica]
MNETRFELKKPVAKEDTPASTRGQRATQIQPTLPVESTPPASTASVCPVPSPCGPATYAEWRSSSRSTRRSSTRGPATGIPLGLRLHPTAPPRRMPAASWGDPPGEQPRRAGRGSGAAPGPRQGLCDRCLLRRPAVVSPGVRAPGGGGGPHPEGRHVQARPGGSQGGGSGGISSCAGGGRSQATDPPASFVTMLTCDFSRVAQSESFDEADLRSKLGSAETLLNRGDGEIDALAQECELETARARLSEAQTDLSKQTDEIEKLVRARYDALSLQKKSSAMLASKEAVIDSFRVKTRCLEGEVSDLTSRLEESQNELSESRGQRAGLASKLRDAETLIAGKQAAIESLRSERDRAVSALSSVEGKYSSLLAEHEAVISSRDNAHNAHNEKDRLGREQGAKDAVLKESDDTSTEVVENRRRAPSPVEPNPSRLSMLTRVLMKYLWLRDREMHTRAKAQIEEYYEKNKQGDPNFESLMKRTVGDAYWK